MKKTSHLLFNLFAVCMLLFAAQAQAKNSYLNSVNTTCQTSYGCDLCHVDPSGGGPLNADGQAYVNSGYDPTYFCPGTACTDNDGDGFYVEGGSCGAVDCDDNNAAINPGAAEVCDDIVDNDCDNNADCDDSECSSTPLCDTTGGPEICDDGIDNDGDGLADCFDTDCGPPVPGPITPSQDPVCVGDIGVTYTIAPVAGTTGYVWTVPAGASITAGQGTTSITVTWISNIGGEICVASDNLGCTSLPSCITVLPDDVPPIPGEIDGGN